MMTQIYDLSNQFFDQQIQDEKLSIKKNIQSIEKKLFLIEKTYLEFEKKIIDNSAYYNKIKDKNVQNIKILKQDLRSLE